MERVNVKLSEAIAVAATAATAEDSDDGFESEDDPIMSLGMGASTKPASKVSSQHQGLRVSSFSELLDPSRRVGSEAKMLK